MKIAKLAIPEPAHELASAPPAPAQQNGSAQILNPLQKNGVDNILTPIVPEVLRAKVGVFVELWPKTEQIKQQAERLREVEEAEHRSRLAEAEDKLDRETKRNRFFTLALDMLGIGDFDGRL